MSPARDLPARPSLDSLRKQAKRLARDASAGSADAVARIHAHLPHATLPLSHRDAQLVVAREYGFPGWSDLTAEVQKRTGNALEWAASQARVAIHDHDNDRLRELLAEYPALVSWRQDGGENLLSSTTPYALDVSNPEREKLFTRPEAAEILIDAGVRVQPSTWEYLIFTGASTMLHTLARKGALPQLLPILAALGDDDAVQAALDEQENAHDKTVIARAVTSAARFRHRAITMRLVNRAIELDPELGRRIDRWKDRDAFVDFLIEHHASWDTERPEATLWQSFVIRQLTFAQDNNDIAAFRQWLAEESWVLEPPFVHLQIKWIDRAAYGKHKDAFIAALLERNTGLLRAASNDRSTPVTTALAYGNGHLVPMLTRVWPLPDDLPHAAGTGNAAAVARWFDDDGKPALGSLKNHYPGSDPRFPWGDMHWDGPTVQRVLDVAFAWAAHNHHFAIAELLLKRGANINTTYSTHEPASPLHEAAISGNEPAVRFLIDHGVDLDVRDYRYQSTAEGWARYGANDEHMAGLLASASAERRAASSESGNDGPPDETRR